MAGYRVLRSAGRGDRARLLLGFEHGRTVVLKAAPSGDARVRTEIEALSRAAGDHVVVLEDLASDESRTVLVLERLPNGSLAELLERRADLDAGEAVTILVPLALTVDRLHDAGVAHGSLSLAAVCFRADGAPTLVGFGSAQLFAPGSPEVVRETVPGVIADRAALLDIAGVVLGRVRGPRAEPARRLAATRSDVHPAAFAESLFALAPAEPVRFDEPPREPAVVRVGEPRDEEFGVAAPGVVPAWLENLLPDWVRAHVAGVATRLLSKWGGWEPRRRRVALAGVAAAITLVLALAVVPAAPPVPQADPSEPHPVTLAAPEPTLPDDPVEAAVLLLSHRESCVRDLSVLCLDAVLQPGSAALADDTALIRAVQAGAEYPQAHVIDGAPVLVERLGDSALLDLPEGSEPASLLLMRTAEGWRIRDYLERVPALRSPASGRSRRSRDAP